MNADAAYQGRAVHDQVQHAPFFCFVQNGLDLGGFVGAAAVHYVAVQQAVIAGVYNILSD